MLRHVDYAGSRSTLNPQSGKFLDVDFSAQFGAPVKEAFIGAEH